MPLKNRETGEPPKLLEELEQAEEAELLDPQEELERLADEGAEKYENLLLKKSLSGSIRTTTQEYAKLKTRFNQLISEYGKLLQKEEKSRSEWQEKLNKKLNELQSMNQQLQNSIDKKIKDMSGELERRTIEKVEKVTGQADKQIAKATEELQRAAFGIGIFWKILMGAGSVAWILILIFEYIANAA